MKWFLSFLMAHSLFAAELAVVKVRSTLCSRPEAVFRVGTGVVIDTGADRFVVTSSHVLFHGDRTEGICHQLSGAASGDANLIAADFTKGLALLRPAVRPSVAASFGAAPAGTGPATLAGFPFASETPNIDSQALVINPASTRSVIPRVRTLAEVKGHSEYGMSGGGLFDERGNLLGLLSHQYVGIGKAGEIGKVQEYAAGLAAPPSLVALVIPHAEVVAWVKSAAQGSQGFNFREDLKGQINRRVNSVGVGGMQFIQPRNRGGDGIGIGGTLAEDSNAPPTEIELNLDPSAAPQQWPFASASWRERALRKIRARASLAITGFERGGIRFPVPDLMTAFAWIDQGYEPLIRVRRSAIDDISTAERVVTELGVELERVVGVFQSLSRGDVGQETLYSDLALLTEKIRNTQYEAIREVTLDGWLEPPVGSLTEEAWTAWFNRRFEETGRLKALLYRIREELRKLRV